jgi:hypothetical protein
VRDFTITLRKHEQELGLSRAATLIAYGRCFMDDDSSRPTGGEVAVDLSQQAQASTSNRVLCGEPNPGRYSAELYGMSIGRSGHQLSFGGAQICRCLQYPSLFQR